MVRLSKQRYIGLGQVPIGVGAVIKGWNITEENYRDLNRLPVVDFRAMTKACPRDCFHCFTDKLKRDLTLDEIKNVIDQLADANTHTIDFVGEGEPTIDKNFFEIVEYTASRGIQPVVYTEAATKLCDRDFAKRLYESGASVSPKCDSLFDEDYQNWVVGNRDSSYFKRRNEAIDLLIDIGFNEPSDDGTTRMGFDMVVSRRNLHDVERTLRYCRENNLWVIFVFFLPSGRSAMDNFDKSLMVTEEEKIGMRDMVQRVDEEYGFSHGMWNNFATTRCIEFMQIFGDGRVSPCPGNDRVIGNVRTSSIKELEAKILERFPAHDRATFDGECPYRPACNSCDSDNGSCGSHHEPEPDQATFVAVDELLPTKE